jgi:WD40 repeat protein
MRTLRGHSDAIYDLSVLPDGCRVISASQDKTLKVWDLNRGVLLHTLTGHSQPISAVVALPDARRALSAAADNTLKVWDLVSGKELATLNTGYSYLLSALSVALDGRRAVTLSYDGILVIWDIERYQALCTVQGHVYSANTVKVLPCSKRFVSSGGRGSVKVWDLETGTCLAAFTGEGEFQSCAVTPGGQIIVMGERSGRIHFLRLENLQGDCGQSRPAANALPLSTKNRGKRI